MIGAESAAAWPLGGRDPQTLILEKFAVYFAQTLVCGLALTWFWRRYALRWPRRLLHTFVIAFLIFVIWVAPQFFFGAMPRREGFDPMVFEKNRVAFFAVLIVRFLRLVVIVPLVEEIFWRGFLLRWLIREDFQRVEIGAFSRFSFLAVSLAFMLEHQPADWPAALAAGALFNCVAYRTRSLSSCILAHAATNLLLGVYVFQTRQWGFW